MANAEHLRRLREASAAPNIAAWNKWREETRIIPLLGGADLTRADLENADLKEVDLRSASLIGKSVKPTPTSTRSSQRISRDQNIGRFDMIGMFTQAGNDLNGRRFMR